MNCIKQYLTNKKNEKEKKNIEKEKMKILSNLIRDHFNCIVKYEEYYCNHRRIIYENNFVIGYGIANEQFEYCTDKINKYIEDTRKKRNIIEKIECNGAIEYLKLEQLLKNNANMNILFNNLLNIMKKINESYLKYKDFINLYCEINEKDNLYCEINEKAKLDKIIKYDDLLQIIKKEETAVNFYIKNYTNCDVTLQLSSYKDINIKYM